MIWGLGIVEFIEDQLRQALGYVILHKIMDVFIIRIHADMQPANLSFECLKCGNSLYASRDSISSLTIEYVHPSNPVGTTPGTTEKFEEVEKTMVSPHESDKTTNGDSGQKVILAAAPIQGPQNALGDVAVEIEPSVRTITFTTIANYTCKITHKRD